MGDEIPILEQLKDEYENLELLEVQAKEDRTFTYEKVKIKMNELKKAKSAHYQASKNLKEIRAKKKTAFNKWKSYTSYKRNWAKKNLGKVIENL